jgi:hypothetical protein
MQEQSILQRVPSEILLAILNYLPQGDLQSLRLVSRALLHLVTPRVFSKISIDVNTSDHSSFHRNLSRVKSLATTSSVVSSLVRILHINSLHGQESRFYPTGASTPTLHKPSLKDIAETVLPEHLAPFLSNLQNLEAIVYKLPSVPPVLPADCFAVGPTIPTATLHPTSPPSLIACHRSRNSRT